VWSGRGLGHGLGLGLFHGRGLGLGLGRGLGLGLGRGLGFGLGIGISFCLSLSCVLAFPSSGVALCLFVLSISSFVSFSRSVHFRHIFQFVFPIAIVFLWSIPICVSSS
jgi:hypothetical protein